MSNDNNNKTNRRDFITLTASSMILVGGVCVAWTLIDTFNPSADVISVSTVEIDLTHIKPGQSATFKWQGKPIFVRNRLPDEISEARLVNLSELKDPQTDQQRIKEGHDNWLVMIGICTHLGCVPIGNQGEFNGWFCPCHGSQYDSAGRIRKGPAPYNLAIPKYMFLSKNRIKIGTNE